MKHYSISHQMSIASIPPVLLGELRPHEIRLLNALFWFWRKDGKKNPHRAPKCWPSEQWLAEHARCSRFTVSRAVRKLRILGILTKFQIRTRGGTWRTNIYRMGSVLLAWLNRAISRGKDIHRNRLRGSATNKNHILNGDGLAPFPGAQKVPAYPAGAT